ncbi:MAG: HEAT repeat domain-containing protein [Chloroflexi bacterium]|nr:HEAT repeat domain-containing protein [Chloroflexota bacterium]
MPAVAAWLAELSSGDAARAEAAALQPPEAQQDALDGLARLLGEEDAEARWWATRALAEFKQAEAGKLLVAALQDEDESVRHTAMLSLRQNPQPIAIDRLIELLGSPEALEARLAGDALIAQGKAATPGLLAVLEPGSETGRVEAARALAHIKDLRSVSALFQLLESDSVMLEHWANEGLEAMGIGMRFFATE